jgi:hypothetical protein
MIPNNERNQKMKPNAFEIMNKSSKLYHIINAASLAKLTIEQIVNFNTILVKMVGFLYQKGTLINMFQ